MTKQTPLGGKEVTLNFENKTASIDGLPARRVFYGTVGNFEGCCFKESGLVKGKEIVITLPNAPSEFIELFKPEKKEQPKIDHSGLGAGFRDDEMEVGTKQAIKNMGLGNPFISQREPNWRVAHRDS